MKRLPRSCAFGLLALILVIQVDLAHCNDSPKSQSFDFKVIGNQVVQKDSKLLAKEKANLNRELRQALTDVQRLLTDAKIVSEIKKGGAENAKLSEVELHIQDTRWEMSGEEYKPARDISARNCSEILRRFRAKNSRYTEIFVTDRHGFNICQTNKTSDYFQADEQWWMKGFNKGDGKLGFEPLSFDESSRSFAYSVYAPVRNPEDGSVIGVCKALIERPR